MRKNNSTYDLACKLYNHISGEAVLGPSSKFDISIKILNAIEDIEIEKSTGKDPKIATMSLFTNGDDRYYKFDKDITSGDFIEGQIKISGIIPAGNYRGFAINDEIAAVLMGTNYSAQAISIKKSGDRYISK